MENQTTLEAISEMVVSGGLVVGSSAVGVFGGRQQGDGGQRLRHGGGGGGGRGNFGRGVSAARVEDTALTAEVPEWLNYVELGVTGCSLVFVLVTSSVVLAVIACTPSLHRIPGMVMALLSVIDILLALFDSGNIVIRLADQLFALQLNYYRIFCQLQFFANNYIYQLQSATIMAAALDRVMAIAKPLQYHCNHESLAKVLLALLVFYWLVLSPLCVVTMKFAHKMQWLPSYTACAAQFKQPHIIKIIMSLQYLLGYIIPGVVIVACYVIVANRIRKRFRTRQQMIAAAGHVPNPSDNRDIGWNNQLSICKTLIFITFVYYVSFLPFFVYQFLIYFYAIQVNAPMYRGLKMFRNLGALTDGLIFYKMSSSFQTGLRALFKRKPRRQLFVGGTPNEQKGARQRSQQTGAKCETFRLTSPKVSKGMEG